MFGRRQHSSLPLGPFWRQQGWIASAIFLAIVVIVAAVGWLTSGGRAEAGRPAATGPLSAAAPRGPDGRPVGCHTDDRDTSLPGRAPAVTWRRTGTVSVPISATAGPLETTGPLLWCFAHTRLGAAIAAQVITGQMSASAWRAVSQQQVVAGRARDYFEALQPADPQADPDPDDTDPDDTPIVYRGFSVTAYSPAAATVRLLLDNGTQTYGGGYLTTTVRLAWDGGDWKVRPTTGASLYSTFDLIAATTGFVLWENNHG